MIQFFGNPATKVIAVASSKTLSPSIIEKLHWLFGGLPLLSSNTIMGIFYGPRASMVTPWSTNAVEITQNMGIQGIVRMEEYLSEDHIHSIDPMLTVRYEKLDQSLFTVAIVPETL